MIKLPAHLTLRNRGGKGERHKSEAGTCMSMEFPDITLLEDALNKPILDDLDASVPRGEPAQHGKRVVGMPSRKARPHQRRPRPPAGDLAERKA